MEDVAITEAQERIAEVVRGHALVTKTWANQGRCRCGEEVRTFPPGLNAGGLLAHDNHLAVEVDKALGGLAQEHVSGMRVGDDPRMEPIYESRWVSGWKVTE